MKCVQVFRIYVTVVSGHVSTAQASFPSFVVFLIVPNDVTIEYMSSKVQERVGTRLKLKILCLKYSTPAVEKGEFLFLNSEEF